MTIVLDTVMSADGKVRPGQPRVIRLQYDLVRAAGEAKKRCPTLIGAYEAHVLHLAIVIAHEIQHCLRLTMDGVPDDSPPKVLSHLHFGRRRFQGGVEFTSSESGWCWEQTMLGGIITRCEVGRGRPGFAYEHQIYELIVREGRRWFKMDEAIIETVVNGYSGWETLLPLSPSEDYPLMRTPHPDARHRDDQDEPEVHDSTQEPHESKTPPHQVIATDVVPRACGYLGPSDEADVDASREIEADMTSMRFQATRC